MTLASPCPAWSDLISLRLSLVLRGQLLPAQVGFWVQLELQHLPCPLAWPRATPVAAAAAVGVPVGGAVTACWAGGAAGPAGGAAPAAVLCESIPTFFIKHKFNRSK